MLRRSSKSEIAAGPEYVEDESPPVADEVIGEGTGDTSTDEDTDIKDAELPMELAGEKASSCSSWLLMLLLVVVVTP